MSNETTPPKAEYEVITGAQPQAPTPLKQPEVYYNLLWRVPPLIVTTQEQKDGLDPAEWTLDPANATAPRTEAHYPKLFFNINVPPVVVGTAEYAASLGSAYQEFAIPPALVKAAEATAADAEKAATVKQDKPAPAHK